MSVPLCTCVCMRARACVRVCVCGGEGGTDQQDPQGVVLVEGGRARGVLSPLGLLVPLHPLQLLLHTHPRPPPLPLRGGLR